MWGGETVTNLGLKNVKCLLNNENHNDDPIYKEFKFQVGDLITRGLLSVSQLCSMGAGVWFGPAPEYKSFIVWDKESFVAAAGPKTSILMKNGTYIMPIREIFDEKGDFHDVEGEAKAPPGQSPSSGSGGPQNDSQEGSGDVDMPENLGNRDLSDPREKTSR